MSTLDPTVLVALISAIASIILAGGGWLSKQIYETRRTALSAKKDTKAVLHQVANDHKENLRDDIDKKHDDVLRLIRELDKSVDDRMNGHMHRFNNQDVQIGRMQDMLLHIITGGKPHE